MKPPKATRRAGTAAARIAVGGAVHETLRTFVHDVVNPLAAIRLSASALRTSKALGERELADVRRTEKAAGSVVKMVEQLADIPALMNGAGMSASDGARTIDLYVLCCELAARRQTDGRAIQCRAFGNPRGEWDRRQVARIVSQMLDWTLALGKRSRVSVAVTGMKQHVRLDVHGLGFLSPQRRQACLDYPATVADKLGGTLTATVAPSGGAVFTLRLPR